MKKIFLTIIMTISISLSGFSQAPRGFYGKVLGNYTTLNSSDLLTNSGIGYGLGINFNWGYHETYNYQIEVLFNKNYLNFKTLDQTYENVYDTKIAINNINTSFYFNYYLLKPDEGTFFVGPQAGISMMFGASFKKDKETDQYDQYLPYLLNDNSFEVPKLLTNLGLGITGGYNNFRFDIRYELGLTNVLKDSKTNSYNENNVYTGPELTGKLNTISFGVSYLIFSPKKSR